MSNRTGKLVRIAAIAAVAAGFAIGFAAPAQAAGHVTPANDGGFCNTYPGACLPK